MSAEQKFAGPAGSVYEYNTLFGAASALSIVGVLHPAVEGHLAVVAGKTVPLGELSAEQVAGLESNVIKGALAAQAAARHIAGQLDGADLIYRMRRENGNEEYIDHLVPRYPDLGDEGDPMLTTDPQLAAHGVDDTPISIQSKYAFSPEQATDLDVRLTLVDAFYDEDYSAYIPKGEAPAKRRGSDILDKILSGAIKARVAYEDDDLAVVVDRNRASKDHVFVASQECVDNWWKLPPETVAKMAVVGLYLAWHMKRQDVDNETGDIVFLTAANQVRHPHDHVGTDRLEVREGWTRFFDFMRRMSPKSSRMSETHADAELDESLRVMSSEQLQQILSARMAHMTGYFAAMRAITPER